MGGNMKAEDLRKLSEKGNQSNLEEAMNVLVPRLKKAASVGRRSIDIQYPKGCNREELRKHLRDLGYKVEQHNSYLNEPSYITISW
jgi:hypothetical protein